MESSKSNFSVLVEYCNSWGYYSQFRTVDQAVKKLYPDVKVTGTGIGGNTGCMEVIVTKSNGEKATVHSKLKGDGRVDKSNIDSIISKLKIFVEK